LAGVGVAEVMDAAWDKTKRMNAVEMENFMLISK
jgi:hypothetical protein